MSKIVIPHVKRPEDNTGIFLRESTYYVRYLENGKKKHVSTGQTKVTAARAFRDRLYAKLLKEGATVASRELMKPGKRAQRAKEDPDKYIRQRMPFQVVINNTVIAECSSKKDAREARDRHLGLK